jgi:hypothetical protein
MILFHTEIWVYSLLTLEFFLNNSDKMSHDLCLVFSIGGSAMGRYVCKCWYVMIMITVLFRSRFKVLLLAFCSCYCYRFELK